MQIDNRYKWKPIREKTTSYYCFDAKASSNSLSPLIFCRLQPTGCYYLNSASYNLQGSSNSYLFSASYNLQEAPTWASYKWTSIKLQLDMEAPTSSLYNKIICWFTWISALFFSFFTVVLPAFKFALYHLWFFTTPFSDSSSSHTVSPISSFSQLFFFMHMLVTLFIGIIS